MKKKKSSETFFISLEHFKPGANPGLIWNGKFYEAKQKKEHISKHLQHQNPKPSNLVENNQLTK